MRFLHTADWHAGKLLRGRSRLDEQDAVRREILDIAVREKIDFLLLSGDLYDSQAPSPDSERLVYQFFSELLGRQIPAVVIGGNHDHPKRLAALKSLLDRIRIYIRPDEPGVIELEKNGEAARVAVLPFVPEKKLPTDYIAHTTAMCRALSDKFSPHTVNILMAHLFVSGAFTSGSEREIHVSPPYAIPPQAFPAGAHYIALGHLHRPQEIPAPSPCFYAGSPLQLDFGEAGQQKRVLLVDASPKRTAHIESIPLSAGRRLRSVVGTIEELNANRDSFGGDFLHVTVRSEIRTPGIADRIRELLPNAVDVRTETPPIHVDTEPRPSRPADLFAAFYRNRRASEPPAEVLRLFRELHDEVTHETDSA